MKITEIQDIMKEEGNESVSELRKEIDFILEKLKKEDGVPLEDWLYLVHHVHSDEETGKETLHHCFMLDHLGNLYGVEHIKGKVGKIYHCLVGLKEDQDVYWSELEAIADGNKVPCADRQLVLKSAEMEKEESFGICEIGAWDEMKSEGIIKIGKSGIIKSEGEALAPFHDDVVEVMSIQNYKTGYQVRTERVLTHFEDKPKDDTMEMKRAYTLPEGYYIGNPKTAEFLCTKKGIRPQPIDGSHNICSIGFCMSEIKWYGWSHRAIYGFKVGSTCKKGDCHYQPANKADFIEDCIRFWEDDHYFNVSGSEIKNDKGITGVQVYWLYDNEVKNKELRGTVNGVFTTFPDSYGKGEWIAKTLEDAKQMAIDFAKGVS